MTIDPSDLPFRELVDAAPDGVIVCDQDGRIVLVNAEAERMFGYERDELVGKSIDVLVPDARARRSTASTSRATPARRGCARWASAWSSPGAARTAARSRSRSACRRSRPRAGLLVTAGIRDVTERRKLERENRRANAYLVSAVDSVRDAFALFDEQRSRR